MTFAFNRAIPEQRIKNKIIIEDTQELSMNVHQNKDDIEDENIDKRFREASAALRKKLSGGRQYGALFSALLSRPGAKATNEDMTDAVEDISQLHRDISLGISEAIIGKKASPVQLAMVGRASSSISSTAWVNELSADNAVALFTALSENIKLTSEDDFISDEALAAQLNSGTASAQYMPVIMKLNAMPAVTQKLYTGTVSPFELASRLNVAAHDLGYEIIDKIVSSEITEKDKAIAKLSVHSVVSELMASAVISEMNMMSREFKAMNKEQQVEYVANLKSSPDKNVLAERAANVVREFSKTLYAITDNRADQQQGGDLAPS